jgi:hypothetical protein
VQYANIKSVTTYLTIYVSESEATLLAFATLFVPLKSFKSVSKKSKYNKFTYLGFAGDGVTGGVATGCFPFCLGEGVSGSLKES